MTDTIAPEETTDEAEGPFIQPVAMEEDPDELFAGDRGVLDHEVRRALVRLLQRRFLQRDRHKDDWKALIDNQQVIESRLNDLFVRLVVDHERGVAYKKQVRSEEMGVPILLKDESYTRAEALVLVHLRTVYQRESTAGEQAARVDVEDVEQTVLTYFAESDGDVLRRQTHIRNALARLRKEGIIEEESEGRYRISSLVEIVLSSERLQELSTWLREQTARGSGMSDEDLDDADERDEDDELDDADVEEPDAETDDEPDDVDEEPPGDPLFGDDEENAL
ncbi:hypothetical protein GCM10028820_27910 [Tessaracoccus terricola]